MSDAHDRIAPEETEERTNPCAREEPMPAETSYQVGYKRPPVASRFQKGQSGNPRGRPKRHKPDPDRDFGMQMVDQLILQEVYREVPIRENGVTVKVPAIVAAVRATLLGGMKGNRLQTKLLLELTRSIEQGHFEKRDELFRLALDGKRTWAKKVSEAKALGAPPPEAPVPHPDDVVVDAATGEVTFRGARTPEEKALVEKAARQRDRLIHLYQKAEPDDPELPELRDAIDRINEHLPERYRRTS